MTDAEKTVDYIVEALSDLLSDPGIVVKPFIKPVGDKLKAWLADKETQKALLEAAVGAENDFRAKAKEQFGNDKLTQAVASFPLYNGELFQAALQTLPDHLDETILAKYLSSDLTKYWPKEFTPEVVQEATALYLDCLRIRLLRIDEFREIVTGLAILRTERKADEILKIIGEILEKLDKSSTSVIFYPLHQLPQPPADFTGRKELIDQLLQDFNTHQGATITGKSIHGLTGMGGIGKTALGLVVAHEIAKEYPDAQIFLDLKGTTTPLSAVDILRHVILSFEPTADLRTLDEGNMRAAYQTVLDGKRVLLFLDNARSAEQIASLQPPDTCAMLVTSRWVFPVPGLQPRRVDLMSENYAEEFLIKLCPRIGDRAAELAKACTYLPLALRIAGSFLQVNDHWKIEKYITQLSDHKKRLAILHQSHEEGEVKAEPDLLATFELSYGGLAGEDQKRWRALGVFPASFDASAAGAMWKLDEKETLKLLGLLLRYSLLDYDETSSRYNLHDLLADYACSKMEKDEEHEARLRHASHYKDVLSAADDLYLKGNENVLLGLRLFDLEWENIRTGQAWVDSGAKNDPDLAKLCVEYPDAGAYVLDLRQHPREKIRWLERAIASAREIGDRRGKGMLYSTWVWL